MKKYCLLLSVLLLLVQSQVTFGQNWQPVNKDYWYNYQHDTANYISHTIKVDSYNDSLYNFSLAFQSDPQFLLRTMQIVSDAFHFTDSVAGSSFTLLPHLNDSISWDFDSSQNITAQIIKSDTLTIFGQLDSIKCILLSSSDSIIASKNHGLLLFPDFGFSNNYYRLIGIEGPNVGELLPTYRAIFDYEIGDVFWYDYHTYSSGTSSGTYSEHGTKRYEVLDKTSTLTSVSYLFKINKACEEYEHVTVQVSTEKEEWITYDSSVYPTVPPLHHNNLTGDVFYYGEQNNIPIIREGTGGIFSEYAVGFGRIFDGDPNFRSDNPLFVKSAKTASWHEELIGYVKNGDTVGTIYSEDYYLVYNTPEKFNMDLSVFPSPSTGSVYVKSDKLMQKIEVIDAFGKIVYQTNSYHFQQGLELSSLANGIYVIKVYGENEVATKKLHINP